MVSGVLEHELKIAFHELISDKGCQKVQDAAKHISRAEIYTSFKLFIETVSFPENLRI